MNILFVSVNEITKVKRGGISVMTGLLAESFVYNYGCKCFLAYLNRCPPALEPLFFNGSYQLLPGQEETVLTEVLKREAIDVVIVQQMPDVAVIVRRIIKHLKSLCRIVYVQHDFLSRYEGRSVWNYLKFSFRYGDVIPRLKACIKITCFPLYRLYCEYVMKKQIGSACDAAEQIVVLSSHFLEYGYRFIGKKNLSKVGAIGNCLTLDAFCDAEMLSHKKKEILIVSRLDEGRKRLTLALKIWKKVETSGLFPDWKLVIVGEGKHRDIYWKMAEKMELRQLVFEGRQPSTDLYYERASVFMMTSDLEGWGLTLTESLQMGVIPVVFDSFESLHDIIQNSYNGFIVPYDDLNGYSDKLMALMRDARLRQCMANNCLISSKHFSRDSMVEKWWKLINKSDSYGI